MIKIYDEILKLKNESTEYNMAIDDVLNLFQSFKQNCEIIHTKSGLLFNGYDYNFKKGKNTLSKTNSKKISIYGKTDTEIFELAFDGHIIVKEDGQKYIYNVIVYQGSEISKLLSNYYVDPNYIPLCDFSIKKSN